MKTTVLTICILISLSSCGKKVTFLPSTIVPAATGFVKVKGDKNDNYRIKLRVRNLADPERLQPPKETYVVWTETEENRALNLGKLRSSKPLFSKARKGELETVTPARPVRFFITAEDNATPQYPSEIILNTRLFKVR